MSRSGCRRLRPRNRKAPSHDQFAHDLTSGPPRSFHVALRPPEKMKNAPGYASLPACSRQETYFFSISPSPRARWKRCVPRVFRRQETYFFSISPSPRARWKRCVPRVFRRKHMKTTHFVNCGDGSKAISQLDAPEDEKLLGIGCWILVIVGTVRFRDSTDRKRSVSVGRYSFL